MNIFLSYAHEDEAYKVKLQNHLSALQRNGIINMWTDTEILAGDVWNSEISGALKNAGVVLLLLSDDFLASNYIYNVELKYALEKHAMGEMVIVPVILRPCDYRSTPLRDLQAVPRNGRAITLWSNIDEAFLDVVKQIKSLIMSLSEKGNNIHELKISAIPVVESTNFDGSYWRKQIGLNKLEYVLEELIKLVPATAGNFRDQLLIHNGRLHEVNSNQRMGLLTHDDFTRTRNQINLAVLSLISEMETSLSGQ